MRLLFIQFFKNTLLLLLSLTLILYLIEALSYVSFLNKHSESTLKISSGKFTYEDSNFVGPANFLNKKISIYPLSGISNIETVYCNENGYFAYYQSDRYGFRNQDNLWDSKEIDFFY